MYKRACFTGNQAEHRLLNCQRIALTTGCSSGPRRINAPPGYGGWERCTENPWPDRHPGQTRASTPDGCTQQQAARMFNVCRGGNKEYCAPPTVLQKPWCGGVSVRDVWLGWGRWVTNDPSGCAAFRAYDADRVSTSWSRHTTVH